MSLPGKKYTEIASFAADYGTAVATALASVDGHALRTAADVIARAYARDALVWTCGNGGSAAIANHFVCDHSKGVHADTDLRPRIHSLSANIETITAIANDISYADVFVHQLRLGARAGDVLVAVSSSGDSENIVRAASWARDNGLTVLAMTGFSGGRVAPLAHVHLHVAGDNYGVIEDAHQSLMHILAQFLRQSRMPAELIRDRRF